MTHKKIVSALGMFMCLLMLVTACGKGGATVRSGASSQAGEAGTHPGEQAGWPTEFRIGYQKSSILLFVKEKQSIEKRLAAHGIRVSWFEFQSGPPLLEALNAGKIDAGYAGGAPAVLAQGTPGAQLVYLAYEPEVARAIVVPKHSTIKSLLDLKGKKVAFAKGSSAHYTLISALATVGLTISDITPVNLQPSDARAAFERGDADAWVIWDPYLADAEEHAGAKILADPKRAAAQFSIQTKIPEEIWRRTLERRQYGVYPLNADVVAAQQRIADSFYQAGLVREKIRVQDAVIQSDLR
ncbi:aliphatic sulfonate ABC transporter substrate-binding protein [Effusibacillus pohliae]|uniref:aliphatic sulfonate ABC transporter substrate-binding protein n=1 Tax=Effusibacillus pohliae TaxID=232270 RepID=UPI000376424C|nr:aliphatic sulfonate ABC transporter substrate-binding protein [Effusibacillus pohliae]